MSHLSSEEFVELLDGDLPAARGQHLVACAACRTKAEALTGVLTRAAAAAEVPAPSPLFWAHLSSRIRAGLAAPIAKTWQELVWWPGSGWAAGLASMLLVLLVSQSSYRGSSDLHLGSSTASHTLATAAEPADDIDNDQAWAVVRTVADDAGDDAAEDAGIATRPDAAERITLELSAREKSELAQLLAGELKRSGT